MKRWHKFVLVLSVLSVLFTSLSVSVFADSVSTDGDTNLRPLFAPSSVRLYDDNHVVDLSLFSGVTISSQLNEDTVLGSNILRYDSNSIWCNHEYYLSEPVHNSDGSFDFSFVDSIEINSGLLSPDRLEFFFNDFYFTGYHDDFPSIFDLSLEFSSGNYDFSILSASLSCTIIYLDSNQLAYDNFTYPSTDFQLAFRELENYLYSNYLEGALVANMSFFVEVEDLFSQVNFDGIIRYEETDNLFGAEAALDAWSDRYGDTIVNETPTILESVQLGLDAVWNTSLFGLFTIGQVFSACAGLALFTWLLKIFNR